VGAAPTPDEASPTIVQTVAPQTSAAATSSLRTDTQSEKPLDHHDLQEDEKLHPDFGRLEPPLSPFRKLLARLRDALGWESA